MSDIKLSDGRTFDIDLSKITLKEYNGFKNPAFMDDESFSLIEKMTGLKKIDLEPLPFTDTQAIVWGLFNKAKKPLFDPS